MDDFDVRNIPEPAETNDEPIPFDTGDEDEQETGVSHSPINLGVEESEGDAGESKGSVKPVRPEQEKDETVSTDRITGVKTFFTKLHPGAIDFLDNQISEWLKKNPGVVVKRTNAVTGLVQGKKAEPNIIISVWY